MAAEAGLKKTWVAMDPMEPMSWPRTAGVYAIYFDDVLIYIGQSSDVGARMLRHSIKYGYARNIHTPWGEVSDTVRVTAKFKKSRVLGDWAMWEIRLIQRLKPIGNRAMKGLSR